MSRPVTTAPWLAISAAERSSSASVTAAGELVGPERLVASDAHGTAERGDHVVDRGQLVDEVLSTVA